jgi:hypothetical protein
MHERLWFMKKIPFMLLLVLVGMCLAQRGFSQGTYAPLYLFTNGDGSITPYQSGQMLEVGQTYTITATPAAGYEFSSWQPVNVFIFIQTNYNGGQPVLPPIESMDESLIPTNIYGADLEFTLQSVTMLSAEGANPVIYQASGWQADFVPVPEPADAAMAGCGFAVMAVVRHRQWRRSRNLN